MNTTNEFFTSIADLYLDRESKQEQQFYRGLDLLRMRNMLDVKTSNLMDLGCGVASYSSMLTPHFERIWLVDLSEAMLSSAMTAISNCSSAVSVLPINEDIRALRSGQFEEMCLVLATGASLCYQRGTLSTGTAFAHASLRSGGVFAGDVWNRMGLWLSDAYSDEYPTISASSLLSDFEPALSLINTGVATEMVRGSAHETYATDSCRLLSVLEQAGFSQKKLYGRRCLSLLWSRTELEQRVRQSPESAVQLEQFLATIPEIMAVSPKIAFVARKE